MHVDEDVVRSWQGIRCFYSPKLITAAREGIPVAQSWLASIRHQTCHMCCAQSVGGLSRSDPTRGQRSRLMPGKSQDSPGCFSAAREPTVRGVGGWRWTMQRNGETGARTRSHTQCKRARRRRDHPSSATQFCFSSCAPPPTLSLTLQSLYLPQPRLHAEEILAKKKKKK